MKGRFLYDPCGEKVTIRGVENQFWNPWLYPDGSIIPEIARTGANTVRIVAYYRPETPPTDGVDYLTIPQIEKMIQIAIANHMIPDVAIAGGKFPSVYLRTEVKQMLLKYQGKILIHMMGEGEQDTTARWISDAKANIAALRTAGYTAPLYVLANYYGRQLPTILSGAPQVLSSDPLHNVIFGWQAYWGEPGNYYQHLFGMTLHQAMQKVRDAPYMIQVGLTYETDPWMNDDKMDYRGAMRDAQNYDIGWLWWDWRLSSGTASLTTDGVYGHWESYGADVAVTDAHSIAHTSNRTTFLNTGGRCR